MTAPYSTRGTVVKTLRLILSALATLILAARADALTVSAQVASDFALEIEALINQYRVSHGVAPLDGDDALRLSTHAKKVTLAMGQSPRDGVNAGSLTEQRSCHAHSTHEQRQFQR